MFADALRLVAGIATAALCFAQDATKPAAAPAATHVLRPLALARPPREVVAPLWPTVMSLHDLESFDPISDDPANTTADGVVDLLRARHRAACDAGRLLVEMFDETTVSFRGDPVAVAACVREFDAFVVAMQRPIEVRAWQLPLGDGPLPPVVWNAAATAQNLRAVSPLWQARALTRADGRVALGAVDDRRHVGDVDCDLAGAQLVANVRLTNLRLGPRTRLQVHVLPDGRLLLRGSWLLGEFVAMHHETTGGGSMQLDLPEVRTVYASFAGCIDDCGALAVTGRGGDLGPAGFQLVVSARFAAPALVPPMPMRRLGALLRQSSTMQPTGELFAAFGRDDFYVAAAHPSLTGDAVRLLLQPETPSLVTLFDDMLVLPDEAEAQQQADAVLAPFFARFATYELHGALQSANGTPSVELRQPLLAEVPAGAFVGRERALLLGEQVEIGQGLGVNPVVGAVRSGLWSATTVLAMGDGCVMNGTWTAVRNQEPRTWRHDGPPRLAAQAWDRRGTTLPWNAPMALDQLHVLGDAAAGGEAGEQVAVRLVRR